MDQVNAVIWIDLDDDLGSLKTDVTAVVQILFNLIDNVTMPANMFYQTVVEVVSSSTRKERRED